VHRNFDPAGWDPNNKRYQMALAEGYEVHNKEVLLLAEEWLPPGTDAEHCYCWVLGKALSSLSYRGSLWHDDQLASGRSTCKAVGGANGGA
jgi:hypothetical protein